jgi:glycosyltransferase involved in cell wall biosynthesis
VELDLTFIGEGPLWEECSQASAQLLGKVRVTLQEPVPYGHPFYSLLRQQDAVLVPSLTDEQPRILFDALSQAVPIIGSDTGGTREVIEEGETGRLVRPGEVEGLAGALSWASRNRPVLRAMGLHGLDVVRGRTHQAMHQRRGTIIRAALDQASQQNRVAPNAGSLQ